MMKLDTGLFDHAVLQRNRRNLSDADFSGTTDATGTVTTTVMSGGATLEGFDARRAGAAARGRLSGTLKGLPAGGPYDVELAVRDRSGTALDVVRVKDVLVGDVWILGGQSNMQGVGLIKDAPKPDPLVRAWYMDDRWGVAKEPVHNMWATVDGVHIILCGGIRPVKNTVTGVCPGVAFAQRMRELTGVPQGVLACAHGGTSMSQWDPKLKKEGGRSLYGATVRRVRKTGGKVAGVVWYQGESDANAPAAPLYTKRMKDMVRAMRRDFGDATLPIAVVQISRVVGWGPDVAVHWNSVQEQERRLPEAIPNCTVVPAIDLSLDDSIHISGRDQVRLGHRLAQAMHVLKAGRKGGKPPIALKQIKVAEGRGLAKLIVEFDNVVGRLHAGGRAVGFELVDASPGAFIYDTEVDGNRAIIHCTQPVEIISNLALHYGLGADPVCNVTDKADRSLPVFGPIPIGRQRATTPFVSGLRVSEFQTGAGKLHDLKCPKDLGALGLRTRQFAGNMCDLHEEIGQRAPEDLVLYFVCDYECTEPMKLRTLLGYDGPVKVWVDGRQALHDPAGTNPANADVAELPVPGTKGKHHIVVALSTNSGRAWGILLRLERLGVSKRLLQKGPGFYAMPLLLG